MSTEFRFRGGRPCLDFVATVVGRYRDPVDQLATAAEVGRWLQEAGLVLDVPDVRMSDIIAVHELREAIYRLIHPETRATPAAEDIRAVNHFASHESLHPVLASNARAATNSSPHPVQACLSMVARDAIQLLASPDLDSVRECSRAQCSVLFLDSSRSGQRRWCDMTRCGNQAKATRHRRRKLPAQLPTA